MNKRASLLLLTAVALTVFGAGCYGKTSTTTNTTSTVTTNTADMNTNTTTNSSTTGSFITNTSVNAAANGSVSTGTASVSIANMSFFPATLTVKKGTKVTWTNNDGTTHTVTGSNGGPTNTGLAPGETYSFTFNTVGTFAYHCNIHSSMTGTVKVTE